ncbi:two-component system sporulation sensor kinase B [Paenibacillus phyllosphaerae]|uniref:histidine kinase n=1 Tax=Paenibacillus phyllosphaerae TaxID=274593 RepID=A0A7W5B561_9BACL|nr:HAMP domain-containing sensor histidine kinase [Paenibacillus phyllosphaerae]MBB3114600.1 two-component system sporulation sensor kinase B [Paenibacillus phyllosphaerae]
MFEQILLLDVLITLVPTFIYGIFHEKIGNNPYAFGLLQGIASMLCLAIPIYDYGLYWDLRYIPLVIGFLYGGPKAGLIVLACILGMRTYIGGDAVVFGYISALLSATVPYIQSKSFKKLTGRGRFKRALLVGSWPGLVMLFILTSYLLMQDVQAVTLEQLFKISFFTLALFFGLTIATTLNEAIIERETMKKELLRAEKINTIGELAASIAHEIRNPLTVVKGFLQLNSERKEGQLAYIPIMLEELGRAEAIINDYLNVSRPKLEKIERFELAPMMANMKILLDPLANIEGVILLSDLDEGLYLETDRARLQQALINLIKNAIEATPSGGVVTLRLKRRGHEGVITIADTGRGMSEGELSRLGTLFYSTKEKGTGLGTSVSLRIIEMMHGQISFKSELNVGTEITVVLPLQQDVRPSKAKLGGVG